MAGHHMRYVFRPIAIAPTCVEKSMKALGVYATISLMLGMTATLVATDLS